MLFAIAIVLAMIFPLGHAEAQARGQRGRRARQTSTNPLGRGQEVVEAGRQLYNSSCTVCHGLDGTVGDRGPALAAARRYLRTSDDDLFNAIKTGEAIDGVVKNEDNVTLQVLDRAYQIHLLKREELEQIQYEKESLMPYRYDKTLKADEMQDLLAFLSRQVRQ